MIPAEAALAAYQDAYPGASPEDLLHPDTCPHSSMGGNMTRTRALAAALVALATTVGLAGVSAASVARHPAGTRPALAQLPLNPDGTYTIGDGGSTQEFFNDPGYQCGPFTWVIDWPWVAGATNENVRIVAVANGYWELYFTHCGDVGCIWDDVDGSETGSTHGLYQDYCLSTWPQDLWKVNYSPTCYCYWFTSAAEDRDILAWNTKGLLMRAWSWDGGNTEWVLFGPN